MPYAFAVTCVRAIRLVLRVAWAAIIIAAIAAALAAARLAVGPIAVGTLVAPAIERANDGLGGWRIAVDDVILRWEREAGRIGVGLAELQLFDPAGSLAASAPSAFVRLDAPAAVAGRLSVREIELQGLDVAVRREADGRVRLSATRVDRDPGLGAAPGADGRDADLIADALAAIAAAADADAAEGAAGGVLSELSQLSMARARLSYEDPALPAPVQADEARLALVRVDSGWELEVETDVGVLHELTQGSGAARGPAEARAARSASLPADDQSPASAAITLRAALPDGAPTEPVTVTATFRDAPIAALAAQLPDIAPLAEIDGLASGAVAVRFSHETGAPEHVSASLSADGAQATWGGGVTFSRVHLSAGYTPDTGALRVRRFSLGTPEGDVVELGGGATVPFGEPNGLASVEGGVTIRALRIARPGLWPEPLDVDGGRLSFQWSADNAALIVPAGWLQLGETRLEGNAAVDLTDAAETRADFTFDKLTTAQVKRLWPAGLGDGARRWFLANILEGTLYDGRFAWRGAEPPESRARFDFRFEDTAGLYLRPMPPITRAAGQGVIAAGQFEVSLNEGWVQTEDAGAIDVRGSRFAVPDLSAPIREGDIALTARGPIDAALALIDLPPLALVSKLGADLGSIDGTAIVSAELALPLLANLPLAEVSVAATAQLENVRFAPGFLPEPARFEAAVLEASTRQLTLNGRAEYDGETVDVAWTERFGVEEGEARTLVALDARLTAASMRRRGAPSGVAAGGAADIDAELRVIRGGPVRLDADLNLRDLVAEAPALGWRKASGDAGEARVAGRWLPGGDFELQRFSVASAGLAAQGSGRFGVDGGLERLELQRAAIGQRTEMAVSVRRSPNGSVAIAAQGPRIDFDLASGAAAGSPSAAAERATATREVALTIRADRATFSGGHPVRAFAADLSLNDAGLVDGDIAAQAGRNGRIDLTLEPDGRAQEVRLTAAPAGDVLTSFGYGGGLSGGDLTLEATFPAAGPGRGLLSIDSFVVRDAPAAAQALSIGTVIGVIDGLASGGVSFSRIRVPFELRDDRVALGEAMAVGPSLGVVLTGVIFTGRERLDLRGVLSPAMFVSSAISAVPVLGDIVTGGEGEGVVAFNFTVRGPFAAPEVAVNPLSALTPGFLRNLFDRRGGSEIQGDEEGGRRLAPSSPSGASPRQAGRGILDR